MPKFDVGKFQEDALECHNKLRKEHGAPPLEFDAELTKLALYNSNQMCTGKEPAASHAFKGIGQLTVVLEEREPVGEEILNNIGESASTYDFSSNECPESLRPFAQTIWVDSTKFGCGISSTEEGKHFIVFMYKPPGNVIGNYKHNVFPKGTPLVKRYLNTPKPLDFAPDNKQLENDMLKYHNESRGCHSSPNLEWDQKIAQLAKEHAAQLLREKLDGKEFSKPPEKYGRNTLVISGIIPSVATCCKTWYQTSKGYDYDKNSFQVDSSSFCQMVWHDTKHMGAAYASDKDKCVVVALYSPSGNISSGYKRNVSKPSEEPLSFEES